MNVFFLFVNDSVRKMQYPTELVFQAHVTIIENNGVIGFFQRRYLSM